MVRQEPGRVIRPPVRGRAAVLGSPIGHSLSPVLHRAAYAALGLAGWSYSATEVDDRGLADWLHRLDHRPGAEDGRWVGLSLTMPLKKAVIPLADRVSDLALAVGAVNTVVFEYPEGTDRGPVRIRGENTDVYGITSALAEAGVVEATSAVVLGAGATAASAVAALRELGCRQPVVMARSEVRARGVLEAAERLGIEVRLVPLDRLTRDGAWDTPPEVVVSTLPAGAADPLLSPVLTEAVRRDRPVLLDVVYAPWPTPLASVWTGHDLPVVSGLAMLLHQAVAQVELMTGLPGPVTAMRGALDAELARRAGDRPRR